MALGSICRCLCSGHDHCKHTSSGKGQGRQKGQWPTACILASVKVLAVSMHYPVWYLATGTWQWKLVTVTKLEAYKYTAGGASFMLAQCCRPMTEDRTNPGPQAVLETLAVCMLSCSHMLSPPLACEQQWRPVTGLRSAACKCRWGVSLDRAHGSGSFAGL